MLAEAEPSRKEIKFSGKGGLLVRALLPQALQATRPGVVHSTPPLAEGQRGAFGLACDRPD